MAAPAMATVSVTKSMKRHRLRYSASAFRPLWQWGLSYSEANSGSESGGNRLVASRSVFCCGGVAHTAAVLVLMSAYQRWTFRIVREVVPVPNHAPIYTIGDLALRW